ncbi:MAG: hypothetical protein ACT4QD_22110 [Acidobacteriota bacterium]
MKLWTADDLDLVGPAHLTLERDGLGAVRFLAIEAGLDYRVVQRDGQPGIACSFDGSDEGDRISGRGWAVLEGDALHGRIFIHHGDDSGFTANPSTHEGPRRRRRA